MTSFLHTANVNQYVTQPLEITLTSGKRNLKIEFKNVLLFAYLQNTVGLIYFIVNYNFFRDKF